MHTSFRNPSRQFGRSARMLSASFHPHFINVLNNLSAASGSETISPEGRERLGPHSHLGGNLKSEQEQGVRTRTRISGCFESMSKVTLSRASFCTRYIHLKKSDWTVNV